MALNVKEGRIRLGVDKELSTQPTMKKKIRIETVLEKREGENWQKIELTSKISLEILKKKKSLMGKDKLKLCKKFNLKICQEFSWWNKTG